jgi:hypothetical protein
MIAAMAMPRAISILLCLAMAGCPGDDGGGDTTGASASSTAAETGSGMTTPTGATSTSMSTTDGTQGGTGSSGQPPTTEGPGTDAVTSTSGPASSSTSAGSAEGGDACDPAAQDHPCLECFVDDCCKYWTQCLADEGCTCIIDCHVIEGGSLGSCESQCNSDGELYETIFFCGQMYCLGTCEWDCC